LLKTKFSANSSQAIFRAPNSALIIFCVTAIFIVIVELIAKPLSGLVVFSFLSIGVGFFFLKAKGCCGWSRSNFTGVNSLDDLGNVESVGFTESI
jgi:hypothetical protein